MAQTDTSARTSVGAHFLQGLAMGTADVIPGVSGGTIALILGIYTQLVGAIRTLAGAPSRLVKGDMSGAREKVAEVPWPFVLPVGIGLLTALGIGSAVLPPLLEAYPSQTSALFFGLIVASLQVPWRRAQAGHDVGNPMLVGIAAVAAVAAFLVMGLPELVVEHPPLWRVFISAMVAICAMILPGVSGAFLLLALGIYEPTLEAVGDRDLAYVGTFVLGAIVGLGAFARVLGHLLDKREQVTMAALTGLMLGALRVLWPWGGREGMLHAPDSLASGLVGLALAAVGFVIVYGLISVGRRS